LERIDKLCLTTLDVTRQRGDLILAFKILKGIEKVDLYAPVKLTASLTSIGPARSLREHKMRIEMEIVKNCDQIKHLLTNRDANAWNKLPREVSHAPSVKSFKAKLDNQYNETKQKKINRVLVFIIYSLFILCFFYGFNFIVIFYFNIYFIVFYVKLKIYCF
jgi:hypothetical protein